MAEEAERINYLTLLTDGKIVDIGVIGLDKSTGYLYFYFRKNKDRRFRIHEQNILLIKKYPEHKGDSHE